MGAPIRGRSFDHWETNRGYWNMLSAANLELQKPTIYVNSNVRFVLLVKAGFSRCLICGCFSHRVGQYRCQEAALDFPDLANPAVAADGVDQEGTSQKVDTE